MSRQFTVTAERGRTGWWVTECAEVGAVSQVRRLDQASDDIREAVAYLAGLPEDDVAIDVVPVSSPGVSGTRCASEGGTRKRSSSQGASGSRIADGCPGVARGGAGVAGRGDRHGHIPPESVATAGPALRAPRVGRRALRARQRQRSFPAPDAFRDTRLQDRSNPERSV